MGSQNDIIAVLRGINLTFHSLEDSYQQMSLIFHTKSNLTAVLFLTRNFFIYVRPKIDQRKFI